MTTRWLRASRITTSDFVVTGGENNPLQPGGPRRVWKVAEVVGDGRTTLRIVLVKRVGGDFVRDPAQAWITQTFDSKLKLRVIDAR